MNPSSSLCTRRKTSPRASLVGSYHPRPDPHCTFARNSSISGSYPVMPSSRLAGELDGTGLRSFSAPALPADREAGALQRRAERAGACDGPLRARASGSHFPRQSRQSRAAAGEDPILVRFLIFLAVCALLALCFGPDVVAEDTGVGGADHFAGSLGGAPQLSSILVRRYRPRPLWRLARRHRFRTHRRRTLSYGFATRQEARAFVETALKRRRGGLGRCGVAYSLILADAGPDGPSDCDIRTLISGTRREAAVGSAGSAHKLGKIASPDTAKVQGNPVMRRRPCWTETRAAASGFRRIVTNSVVAREG